MNTVKIIPNPFTLIAGDFVALITSGRFANRSYIADGRSSYGRWPTAEEAKAAAIRYGYMIED